MLRAKQQVVKPTEMTLARDRDWEGRTPQLQQAKKPAAGKADMIPPVKWTFKGGNQCDINARQVTSK